MRNILGSLSRKIGSSGSSEKGEIEQVELKGFASSIAEIEWLLLLLIILYYVTPDATKLNPIGLVTSMIAFTLFVLGFHYLNASSQQKRWKLALETWVMIVFITWVIWNTGGINSPLINLYLLVIIISAITLGKVVTLLEIALIGAFYFYIASYDNITYTYAEFSRVMIYFSPFVLVAYITTLLVADLNKGRSLFKELAETDEMTHLLNKRSFMPLYKHAAEQALSNSQPLTAMMIDADNLKEVNDKFGHQAGDKLILTVAKAISDCLRATDIVCRYGGDEFVAVLPKVDPDKAWELGERLRKAVANTSFDVGGNRIAATVSIGIATYPQRVPDITLLLEKADESLYLSKRTGRNRVMQYGEEIVAV
jgi:diguanylate cyclase (GGDEF)-like protein